MLKNKAFSSGVIIVLIIACVVFSIELFGCTPGRKDVENGSGSPEGPVNAGGSVEEPEMPLIDEWVLPVIVSITGADSDMGLAAAWGFDYGVKAINEQGGIRGVPVKITIRDATSSDTKVATEINQVANDSMVIMGPPTEVIYKAGEQAFYNARTPVVGAATDPANREAFQPFAISCITDPGSEAVSAVEAWAQLDVFTKICTIINPLNSERTASAKKALTAKGIEIVDEIELGNTMFDAANVAERAFASGADAYYIDLDGEDTLRVIKQLRFLAGANAEKLKYLCGPQAADKELLKLAVEGEMIGVRVWTTLDPNKDAEKRKVFDEAFKKNIGDPIYYGIAVDYYQSAFMLKQAINTLELTGAPNTILFEREMLATYLYNSGLFTTDQGDFTIVNGNKITAANLYIVTDKGFE